MYLSCCVNLVFFQIGLRRRRGAGIYFAGHTAVALETEHQTGAAYINVGLIMVVYRSFLFFRDTGEVFLKFEYNDRNAVDAFCNAILIC